MKLYEQIFNRKIPKKKKISKKNIKSSCKEGYAILLRFFKCLKQKEKQSTLQQKYSTIERYYDKC